MTLYDLCEKDVVNVTTGTKLGRVDDIAFLPETAGITHVVLYGRPKLFGLLGREDDVYIPWTDIQKIGDDVLLVNTAPQMQTKPRQRHKGVLFG